MDGFMSAAALLPENLRAEAMGIPPAERTLCEELRLRTGRPASALIEGREKVFSSAPVTGVQLRQVLESATRSSLHTAETQLRSGFLTAPGGVRVGVCGSGVFEAGTLSGLRGFTSMSLRVPREIPGCADGIWPTLTQGGFASTLVISPPGGGKTTLLREIIRRLSSSGIRVCAADERGELAGDGRFDVGPCTDVLTGIPKADAAMLLLRAMNPEVIAMDELSDETEGRAVLRVAEAGVYLLASVHGSDAWSAVRRSGCRALAEAGVFRRCVEISCRDGLRRYAVRQFPFNPH